MARSGNREPARWMRGRSRVVRHMSGETLASLGRVLWWRVCGYRVVKLESSAIPFRKPFFAVCGSIFPCDDRSWQRYALSEAAFGKEKRIVSGSEAKTPCW